MELCLCFGCPHPDLLAQTLSARELRMWSLFAERRGLPTRTGLQVAQLEWFTRVVNTAKEARGKVPSPNELVVGTHHAKPQPKPSVARSLSSMMHALRHRMVAKDGKHARKR